MDFGFRSRAPLRPIGRAAFDQQRLVAALSAMQAASATARSLRDAQARSQGFGDARAALVELFAGGGRWAEAAVTLRHAFAADRRGQQTPRKPS